MCAAEGREGEMIGTGDVLYNQNVLKNKRRPGHNEERREEREKDGRLVSE